MSDKGFYSTAIQKNGSKPHVESLEQTDMLFVFDMSMPLAHIPDVFYEAEAVYSEPSWSRGFKAFMESQGKPASHDLWKQYMMNIDTVCHELGKPAYIVCGKESNKLLKHADGFEDFAITYRDGSHHSDAKVYLYNGAMSGLETTTKAVEYLTSNYDTILDFSVGYGNTLAYKAKRLIGTDVQAECVSYVIQQRRG